MKDQKRIDNLSPLKKALIAIDEMKARLRAAQKEKKEPIAVIGMASRFPGAKNNDEFWELLKNGRDAVTRTPADRYDIDKFYSGNPNEPGKTVSRFGGYLENVDRFDAHFFGLSPREVVKMDPQQRLLLEIAWETLEDAGLSARAVRKSKTGVFVGICSNDYSKVIFDNQGYEGLDAYFGSGNAASIAANRLSYFFDFQGPSLSVDTACSSSLVSLHYACNSLRSKESDMALVGGVSVLLSPISFISFSQANMLAPGGRCRTFDADAEGYVRGEGCGMVLLKRLSDALNDGDNILALIRGSAVNQDGRTNGLTAPNGLAQESVIKRAMEQAGIKADDIGYVETLGTATKLGDPIEVQALAAAMKNRDINNKCYIGSVKTNIGHLEGASGIAGLIKTILVLQNGLIPQNLHFNKINPHIPIEQMPFEVPRELTPWPDTGKKKCCGVSSFGFGGTNAHVILQEAPAKEKADNAIDRPRHVLALSAQDKNALRDYALHLADHLEKNPQIGTADFCHTINTGRTQFKFRVFVSGSTNGEFLNALKKFARGRTDGNTAYHPPLIAKPRLVFIFPGETTGYAGMSKNLYDSQPVFREVIDRCNALMRQSSDRTLIDILFGIESPQLLKKIEYSAPAIYAIECALSQLWISWGARPDYLIGHGIGEYAAAARAGVFSLEDGFNLIQALGRSLKSTPDDLVTAEIFLDHNSTLAKLGSSAQDVFVAAVNSPQSTIISGKAAVVENLLKAWAEKGIESKKLDQPGAIPLPLLDGNLKDFQEMAASVTCHLPNIPLISGTSGKFHESLPDAAYWTQHIRRAVLFADGIKHIAEQGGNIFIECSPHPSLKQETENILGKKADHLFSESLYRDRDDWQSILTGLGQLYLNKVDIDWKGFDQPYDRRKLQLPTYPFQRERYWADPLPEAWKKAEMPEAVHPILGHQISSPLPYAQYENKFTKGSPLFRQITIHETGMFPMSAVLEMCMAALEDQLGPEKTQTRDLVLENVRQTKLLSAPGELQIQHIQTLIDQNSGKTIDVYASGNVGFGDKVQWKKNFSMHYDKQFKSAKNPVIELEKYAQTDLSAFRDRLARKGLSYRHLDSLKYIARSEDELLMALQPNKESDEYKFINPVVLDCIQAAANFLFDDDRIYLFSKIDQILIGANTFRTTRLIVKKDIFDNSISAFGFDQKNRTTLIIIRVELEAIPDEFFADLIEKRKHETTETAQSFLKSLRGKSPGDQHSLILKKLKSELSKVLKVAAEKIDEDRPLTQMGLDSIMAIELKNNIEEQIRRELPLTSLIKGTTLLELVDAILDLLSIQSGTEELQTDATLLSQGQKAMYFQHKLSPSSVYNQLHAFRVRAKLDIALLEKTLRYLSERHPALRTNFRSVDGKPQAVIHEHAPDFLEQIDARGQSLNAIKKYINKLVERPFDLEKDSLTRLYLFKRKEDDFVFLFVQHHIISDLWSLTVFMKEFTEYYSSGGQVQFEPLTSEYSDYVARQNHLLNSAAGKKQEQFWLNKLKGDLPVLNLPADFQRPTIQTYKGKTQSILLSEEVSAKLKSFSSENDVTPYTTLLAAFKVLLHRYTGQRDIIVGTPASGRNRPEYAGILGYFVNPVAIRSHINGNSTFGQFVQDMKTEVLAVLDNQDYPFNLLVEKIQPKRDPSRTPIFQIMFVYQKAFMMHDEGMTSLAVNEEGGLLKLGNVKLESMAIENRVLPFDITMMMAESDSQFGATLQYNTALFSDKTAQRILTDFETLLSGIAEDPQTRIARIALVDTNLKLKIKHEWEQSVEKLGHVTVLEKFAEIEREFSSRTAVVYNGQSLTFSQLRKQAENIAAFLLDAGICRESVVALCLQPSIETVPAILGILMAGAAYLPIDPSYPEERIKYMLSDARVSFLLHSAETKNRCQGFPVQMINVNDFPQKSRPVTLPEITGNHLAYVIYTSGSTGNPKGVMLEHGGLLNLSLAQVKEFNITSETRLLQFASLSFDAAVSEIFTTLLAGATLYMTNRETLTDGSRLVEFITDNQITTATLPPSILRILSPDALKCLQHVISAGEACTAEIARNWSHNRHFINAYGPTEGTVCATLAHYENFDGESVPIGKSIHNVRVYVLDQYMNPLPWGVPGELYIAGAGVARGYLDKADLTAASFYPDPYSDKPGARMYKTGDLVRYDSEGTIEFLGRIDNQVKIRGFRIETGEIEQAIKSHPQIKDAAVVPYGSSDKRLAAYIVLSTSAEIQFEEVKNMLRQKLPEYMVPAIFTTLDALPLTSNRKIDYKALPRPEAARVTFKKPESETEKKLAAIWQDILNLDNLSTTDNFFELGGHSLNIIQIQERLKKDFNREVDVVEMFRYPTIASFAKFLAGQAESQRLSKESTEQRAAFQKESAQLQRTRMLNRRRQR